MNMKSYLSLLPLCTFVLLLAGYGVMSANWTPAPGTPTNNNTEKPIHVGSEPQTKNGDLVGTIFSAASQMRSNQYCDSTGNNCWDPTTGTPGGGGGDTVTIGGRCFRPAWAVACMWNWSGDGNDTATYIRPLTVAPGSVCGPMGRYYQYHSMILAQC